MNILSRFALKAVAPLVEGVESVAVTVIERFKPTHGGKLHSHQAVSAYDKFFDNMMRTDPDESLRKIGLPRHRLDMLLEDDEIDEKVERRLEHLLQAEYTLSPSEGREAVFVYKTLDRLLPKLLTASINAKLYGYSVCELIWRSTEMDKVVIYRVRNQFDTGYISTYFYNGSFITLEAYEQLFAIGERYISDIVEKPMEWFEPRNDGTLLWFPDSFQQPVEVDTTVKYLIQQHRATYKNPKGKALLSRVYWLWFFKKNGWTFWSKFLERFGSPLLIGSTKGDPDEMAEALAAAHNQSIFTMVEGDAVDSIGSVGNGETFKAYDDAINRRISKYLLGQTLVSGTDGGGTFGQGRVHQDQQEIVFTGDKQFAASYVQRIVEVSCRMNNMDNIPQFVFKTQKGVQSDLAVRDKHLTDQGVEFTENYYEDSYDIDSKYIKKVSAPIRNATSLSTDIAASIKSTMIELNAAAGASNTITPEQAELEALMDAGVANGIQPIDPEAILNVIKTTARADLEKELFALVGVGLEENAFTEFMASVAMVADIHGMVDETLGN